MSEHNGLNIWFIWKAFICTVLTVTVMELQDLFDVLGQIRAALGCADSEELQCWLVGPRRDTT